MAVVDFIYATWSNLLLWLIGMAALFTALEKCWPCNPRQPLWRKDMITDALYYFIAPLINRVAFVLLLGAGMYALFLGHPPENIGEYIQYGFGPLAALPLWLQIAIMFIASDFLLYWLHRWFHGKAMWRFHAIHHSSPQVDWFSTYRFHPVNSWLAFTLVDTLMLLAGFSPACAAGLAGFNMLYSGMVHANLNWTFGPFKYLFASPVFHRWHHTSPSEGGDKNFAPTLPLLDVMFGTFYMPEGRLPEHYGVFGGKPIPDSFAGQMIYPFGK